MRLEVRIGIEILTEWKALFWNGHGHFSPEMSDPRIEAGFLRSFFNPRVSRSYLSPHVIHKLQASPHIFSIRRETLSDFFSGVSRSVRSDSGRGDNRT